MVFIGGINVILVKFNQKWYNLCITAAIQFLQATSCNILIEDILNSERSSLRSSLKIISITGDK